MEACQKKRQCKFKTSPKTFGGDPCPGVRKYVEVAYKCRPCKYEKCIENLQKSTLRDFSDEFRSKVACENERIQLKCNPNSRVAVYSASYGRTEYESIQCPQPQGVREESKLIILFLFKLRPVTHTFVNSRLNYTILLPTPTFRNAQYIIRTRRSIPPFYLETQYGILFLKREIKEHSLAAVTLPISINTEIMLGVCLYFSLTTQEVFTWTQFY